MGWRPIRKLCPSVTSIAWARLALRADSSSWQTGYSIANRGLTRSTTYIDRPRLNCVDAPARLASGDCSSRSSRLCFSPGDQLKRGLYCHSERYGVVAHFDNMWRTTAEQASVQALPGRFGDVLIPWPFARYVSDATISDITPGPKFAVLPSAAHEIWSGKPFGAFASRWQLRL